MSFRIVIEPRKSEKNYWKDLWRYRELFYILSWRDIKVRYKQTTLGIIWAVIRPVLTMIVFTFVFGRVASMRSASTIPYAIIVFAGMLPWLFFANALSESSNSLIGNERLITKVYFPRLIIPASSVITSFVDFLIMFGVLIAVFFWYQYTPPLRILWMPLFWIVAFIASFGPGLWLTALNVKYRDFRYIIPFIVQFGIFLSPVGITSEQVAKVIPPDYLWIYYLNPMAGVIDAFRWCIVSDAPNPMNSYHFYISMAVVVFFLVLAVYQFRKMEKNFADII